jgi:hypothetical protein
MAKADIDQGAPAVRDFMNPDSADRAAPRYWLGGPLQANEAVSWATSPDAERESINPALLEFFN